MVAMEKPIRMVGRMSRDGSNSIRRVIVISIAVIATSIVGIV